MFYHELASGSLLVVFNPVFHEIKWNLLQVAVRIKVSDIVASSTCGFVPTFQQDNYSDFETLYPEL